VNSKVRLLSLSMTFDSDRTLELIFIMLTLGVKVLGFRKEGEFKEEEEEDGDKVNEVVMTIVVVQNI